MNSLGMPTAINGWGELHRNETAQQLGHATRISGTPLFDRASVFNACRRLSGGLDDKTLDPGTPIYRGRKFSEPEMSESMAFWNNRLVLRMGRLKN